MKQILPIIISSLFFLTNITGQTTTTLMYDGIANNWDGNGVGGTFRDLGTDSWKFTRTAGSTGNNFYKVYARSENFDNDFNSPGGSNPSEVWSGGLTINTSGTAFSYGDGNGAAGSYSITSGRTYTFSWQDVAVGTNATAIVMETSAVPAVITGVAQVPGTTEVNEGEAVTITVTLDKVPSVEENVFVRYSTDNFGTYGTLVSPTTAGLASQEFTIPSQAQGTTVTYYVFTSTLVSGSLNGNQSLTDLATINFDNNGGSNYSYTVQAPLPVEFTDFSVRQLGASAELLWQTDTEINNSHFNVERSSDSKNWKTIGRVNGQGTSLHRNNYVFIDAQPITGLNYYRLQQVDLDGRPEYSNVVSIGFNHGNNNAAIYPNPVAENLFIGNMENTGEGMEVFIYNSEGKLIKNKLIQTENNIAVNNLLPGIYFIKIKDQRGAYILKERFVKN